MDTLAPESTRQNLRSQRLNLLTNEPHQRLESLVKSKEPFASRDNFARFVAAQYLFQHDLEPLYRNEALARLFPGLASRARDDAARADLADLGHPVPEGDQSVREADLSLAEALGWLFVSEGSKLGAAFLFKKAAALANLEMGVLDETVAKAIVDWAQGAIDMMSPETRPRRRGGDHSIASGIAEVYSPARKTPPTKRSSTTAPMASAPSGA